MSFSFFDSEANEEFVLRMVRDREPEDKRHIHRKGEISADHHKRGISATTIHFGALWQEEINHIRQVASLARSTIFGIAEAESIRLKDADIELIRDHLRQSITENAQRAQHDLLNRMRTMGFPPTLESGMALDRQITQAISQEAEVAVSLCAKELKRKQEALMSTDRPSVEPSLSPQTITVLADVISGGPGSDTSERRYGRYRTGRDLVTFFANCGVHLDITGMSRVYAVCALLTTINTSPEARKLLTRIIEAAVVPTGYEGPDSHAETISHLNECLKHDGLEISKAGDRWRLQSSAAHSATAIAVQEQAQALDYDSVQCNIGRALEQADNDPEDAITAACSLVESVCRCLLQEMGKPSPDNKDIAHLVAEVQRHLDLSPARRDISPDLKRILGGLGNVANGIGSLRTHAGDAHGADKGAGRVEARTARLAIHAANTISLFFIETWKSQPLQMDL